MTLTQRQKLVLGGGAVAAVLLFVFRKPVGAAASTAVSTAGAAVTAAVGEAERAILRKLVAGGQEGYIDASFVVGEREGVSPYLLMGYLLIESGFGRALTKGSAFGQTVYTGDFIPRPATAARDDFMAKNPLPGAKRVYWERPQIGNIQPFKGNMWVPAHDLRVAQAGGNMAAAYASNGGIANGVGWGFTPWQLDWFSFAPQLKAGAAWNPELATKAAVGLIKSNIKTLRANGLTGAALVEGTIAAYNAGAGAVVAAHKAGRPLTQITAKPTYIDRVLSVAKAVGKSIDL